MYGLQPPLVLAIPLVSSRSSAASHSGFLPKTSGDQAQFHGTSGSYIEILVYLGWNRYNFVLVRNFCNWFMMGMGFTLFIY